MGVAPDEPGKTEMLPYAPINAIAGLVEHLAEEGKSADMYRVGAELGMELDDLLPAVEAAELLGLATVRAGDIALTPLGETFAGTTILVRKEIFARRILLQPTVRWIVDELQGSSEHRLSEDHFLKILEDHFTPDVAERQLDIAINWGRYAEVFEFDDDRDELYLPKMEPVQLAER